MIKVLIADDHTILREGLKRILADSNKISVTGEAGNSREVLREIKKDQYDVILLDISMPGISGLDIIKDIKDSEHGPFVLVLSTFPEEQYALRAMRVGASGFLNKESAPDRLIEAIEKVSSGRKYISPALAEILACGPDIFKQGILHERLSDREYQVMCLIASGKTVSQIGNELCLSVKTISTNRSRLLKKMNMKSNAEVTHYAIKNGLVE